MTLSPSGANRRMACPGSHKLEAQVPKSTSEYAQEGILAHKIAADMLRDGYTSIDNVSEEEMVQGAVLYTGFIRSRAVGALHIEEPLDISSIHLDCRGTPDAWAILPNGEIDIFDYKFGHSFVEVYENWQLIEYAAGILHLLNITELQDQHTFVNMHIIQPRSFHPEGQIRSWRISASDLQPYFNKLIDGEQLATSNNPTCNPSPQCNHCSARHLCPALQATALAAVNVSRSAVLHNLSPAQVSSELRVLEHAQEVLKARISGLSAEALAMLSRGERLPHYYAERGRGRERWNISEKEVIALGEIMGVELSKSTTITPKQAIALKSPLLPAERVRQLSVTPVGELKLMPMDTRKTDKIFGE